MKSLYTLLATAALMLCPLAHASTPPSEYQFELIVYAHITPAGIQSAYWGPSLPGNYTSNTQNIQLKPVTDLPSISYPTLTRLPESAWTLKRAENRLKNKMGAKVLYHSAWRVKRENLLGKRMYFALTNDAGQTPEQSDTVTGTLSVKLSRYFNNDLSLFFTVPSNEIQSSLISSHGPCDANGLCHFRLQQKRRTRSGLVNYFDHPLFGALLLISKHQTPQPPLS